MSPWLRNTLFAATTLGVVVVVGILGFRLGGGSTAAVEPIGFQLPWLHVGHYAGYYAADINGDYAREGLEVRFLEGGVAVNAVTAVVEGKAQLGVTSANHLFEARAEGKPVRAVAVMHQLNPIQFVTLKDSGITHPSQFAGKAIRSSRANMPVLQAVAQRFGVAPDAYTVIQTFDYSPLYSKEVDILVGFHFWSKKRLEKDGQVGHFIYPDNYGVHFYRDCIFTTDEYIAERPDVIAGFLRATLKHGWNFAVRNPQAAAPMIARFKPGADVAFETEFLAAMLPLINTGENPIGWIDPEVWAEMAKTLQRIGILDGSIDATDVYNTRFVKEIYGGRD